MTKELGRLETRFFSCVQMQRAETVGGDELQRELALMPLQKNDGLRRLADGCQL